MSAQLSISLYIQLNLHYHGDIIVLFSGREYGSPDASSSGGFVTGDRVKCNVDMELLTSLQDNPVMAEKIGLVSKITLKY